MLGSLIDTTSGLAETLESLFSTFFFKRFGHKDH